MNACRSAALLLVVSVLYGCSTANRSPYPNLDDKLLKPFASIADPTLNPPSIDQIKKGVITLSTLTAAEIKDTSGKRWGYASATTGGGVLAVLGQLADKTGLLNTGIAAIIGGTTLDGFFQPSAEINVHMNAFKMLNCVDGAIKSLDDGLVQAAQSAPAAKANPLDANDVAQAIQNGLNRYVVMVYGRAPAALTKEQILSAANQLKDAGEKSIEARMNQRIIAKKAGTATALFATGEAPRNSAEADADIAYTTLKQAIADIDVCNLLMPST
jgi:hypothetical protein